MQIELFKAKKNWWMLLYSPNNHHLELPDIIKSYLSWSKELFDMCWLICNHTKCLKTWYRWYNRYLLYYTILCFEAFTIFRKQYRRFVLSISKHFCSGYRSIHHLYKQELIKYPESIFILIRIKIFIVHLSRFDHNKISYKVLESKT